MPALVLGTAGRVFVVGGAGEPMAEVNLERLELT
jgi:hypothetical protein